MGGGANGPVISMYLFRPEEPGAVPLLVFVSKRAISLEPSKVERHVQG